MSQPAEPVRCAWCLGHPALLAYHDTEWGVPVHDDRKHFEFLILDAAQAGLSWRTVLLKRANYRRAFDEFDPVKLARYTPKREARLMQDAGIIRNRLKIASAVINARQFLAVQREFGSFDNHIWRFVGGAPLINHWTGLAEIPARTAQSDAVSKDLKRRGFKFVGSTICYAYMQVAGLVNDHVRGCFTRAAAPRPRRPATNAPRRRGSRRGSD